MKAKVKKVKQKLLNEIEESRRKMQKQTDEISRKVTGQINKFEVTVKEVEKNTLWKIQDCENLLQRRVTQEFVDNSIKTLEDKLLREIAKQKEENFSGVLRSIDDLQLRFRTIDEQAAEKTRQMKKSLKELEDLLLAKLTPFDKFEANKKTMFDKISELENKVVMIDRRGDANKIMESLKDIINQLEVRLF